MRLKPGYIAAFTVIAGAVTAWVLAAQMRPAPALAAEGPWITIPEDSMDARDVRVRHALMSGFSFDGITTDVNGRWNVDADNALIVNCGGDSREPGEQYRLLIGDWTLANPARMWRVDLVRRSGNFDVVLHDVSMPPPPPEPGQRDVVEPPKPGVVARTLSIRDVEPLRAALSAPSLWKTTDAIHGCSDGQPAVVEACIHGRYYVSDKGCGGGEDVDRLWKTATATFPSPPDWLH